MALNVGTRLIGKYTITKVIGEGGFGVVYIAKEELSGKMVAIKEYFPVQVCKRSADGKVFLKMKDEFHQTMYYKGRARFTNEAKSLYEMEHEHIVKVYEYFEENNTAYMVMDYIRGISLKQFLKKNTKLNSAQAEGILQPLIGAIEYLHNFKGGIIHRDIAPDNIIIDMAKGVPILIDFGTTMGLDDSGATAFAKPYYSPIEQSSEGLTDLQGFHTDLYSLAATFYHCLTGSKPEDATARMLNSDEVNLSKTLAEEFDPKLLKLVDLGLIVRPEQRPQSVQKWLELAGYREAPSTNIPTPDTGEEQEHAGDGKTKASRTEPKKSKAPMAFVLLLLVAIGSGAGYYFMPPTTPSVVRVGFELVPASTELKINGKVINSNSTYSIVAGRNYGVSLSAEDYQETSFSVMLNDKGVPIFVPSAGVNALALKSYSDSKGFNMQLRRKKLPLLLETDVSNVDFRVSKLDGDREKTKVPYQAEMELETGEYVIAAVNLDNGQRIEKTVILSDSSPSVPPFYFNEISKLVDVTIRFSPRSIRDIVEIEFLNIEEQPTKPYKLKNQTYSIRVSADGYETKVVALQVAQQQDFTITLQQSSEMVAIAPPTVSEHLKYLLDNMSSFKETTYTAGCDANLNDCDIDERQPQRIQVAPFDISNIEVNNGLWALCYESQSCDSAGSSAGSPRIPITNVSYQEVKQFIDWLNAQTKQTFKLPSEAQWEVAATMSAKYDKEEFCNFANFADSSSPYPWKDDSCSDGIANAPADFLAMKPVMGLYNILGNVWEMTSTCWDAEQSDTNSTDCSQPTVKGGAYNSTLFKLRPSYRSFVNSNARDDNLGFRLVRDQL